MNIFKNEGLILAIVPFLGYMLAYVYEFSYAKTIGFPIDLISISIEKIMYIIILLMVFFSTLIILTYTFNKVFIKNKIVMYEFYRVIIKLLPVSIFSLVVISFLMFLFKAVSGTNIQIWLENTIVFGIMVTIIAYSSYIDGKKLLLKLTKSSSQSEAVKCFVPSNIELNILFFQYFLALILLAFYLGIDRANTQSLFFINKENDSYLIVKQYGDTLISRGYDFDQEVFTDNIMIEKITDKPVVMENMRVYRKDN